MKGITVASKESSASAGGHEHSRTLALRSRGRSARRRVLPAAPPGRGTDRFRTATLRRLLAEVRRARSFTPVLKPVSIAGHRPFARVGQAKRVASCRMSPRSRSPAKEATWTRSVRRRGWSSAEWLGFRLHPALRSADDPRAFFLLTPGRRDFHSRFAQEPLRPMRSRPASCERQGFERVSSRASIHQVRSPMIDRTPDSSPVLRVTAVDEYRPCDSVCRDRRMGGIVLTRITDGRNDHDEPPDASR